MRRCLAIGLAVVGLVPVFGRAQSVVTNTVLGVRTEFISDALLNGEEVKEVVALAKDCGFDQVAEVRTFHLLPTLQRGILATSKDEVVGRTVSYQTVAIYREGWSDHVKPPGPLQTISNGPFWVEDLIPKNHELTIFNTTKGIIRVHLATDVPIAEADEIIEAIANGRILFKDEFVRNECVSIDFTHPSGLSKGGQAGEFSISFSNCMVECGLVIGKKNVTILGETFATP